MRRADLGRTEDATTTRRFRGMRGPMVPARASAAGTAFTARQETTRALRPLYSSFFWSTIPPKDSSGFPSRVYISK